MEYETQNPAHTQQKEEQAEDSQVNRSCIPLTVGQVNSLVKENIIDDQQFTRIMLLGKISAFKEQDSRVKISFTDSTGMIQLLLLTYKEKKVPIDPIRKGVGKYHLVLITAKQRKEPAQGWSYFLDEMRPVRDFNEITKHYSDIILGHLNRNN